MGESINIREYIDMFKRKRVLILIIMLISLAFGGYKTYKNYISYVPTYTSSVTVRINSAKKQQEEAKRLEEEKKNKKDTDEDGEEDSNNSNTQQNNMNYYNYSTAAMDQNIATTYYRLASSSNAYSQVSAITGISPANIKSISAIQQEDIPQFIKINVVCSDGLSAQTVANAMPEVFNNELIRIIGVDCVQTVYNATEGSLIGRPNDTTMIKFAAIGAVLSIFIVLLLECLDTKIVTPDDVEKYWDLPLIGVVPLNNGKKKGKHNIQK